MYVYIYIYIRFEGTRRPRGRRRSRVGSGLSMRYSCRRSVRERSRTSPPARIKCTSRAPRNSRTARTTRRGGSSSCQTMASVKRAFVRRTISWNARAPQRGSTSKTWSSGRGGTFRLRFRRAANSSPCGTAPSHRTRRPLAAERRPPRPPRRGRRRR